MNRTRLIPIAYLGLVLAAGCRPTAHARVPTTEIPSAPATPAPRATDTATPAAGCISDRARREEAEVTAVIDGDTIEVDENGVPFRVRYIGVDAPEMTGEPMAAESLRPIANCSPEKKSR